MVDNGNVTVSQLEYRPVASDQGRTVTCRAENTEIEGAALEDNWKLTIHHAPVVDLSLGANLDPERIQEGNDVYFVCSVRAHPEAYKVVWLHNVSTKEDERG